MKTFLFALVFGATAIGGIVAVSACVDRPVHAVVSRPFPTCLP
jgi:hypothetical protein